MKKQRDATLKSFLNKTKEIKKKKLTAKKTKVIPIGIRQRAIGESKLFPNYSLYNLMFITRMRHFHKIKHQKQQQKTTPQQPRSPTIAPCKSTETQQLLTEVPCLQIPQPQQFASPIAPADMAMPGGGVPPNSQNRIGRWSNQELGSLKLAMSIFGDQSWKKI